MTDHHARIRLTTVTCIDEGDGPGSAEPYLWTVFFKVYGSTAIVDRSLHLAGRSTVRTTPGNHGDLPNHDVDDGEIVLVPLVLGQYRTRLRPIPLAEPIGDISEVSGVIGMVAVLMEEDNTPSSAIAAGHRALDRAVRERLDALVPTLGFLHQEPTAEEVDEMTTMIGAAVEAAVRENVSAWDWLSGAGNMDDQVGSFVVQFSQTELAGAGTRGLRFTRTIANEGEWRLSGRASARRVVP